MIWARQGRAGYEKVKVFLGWAGKYRAGHIKAGLIWARQDRTGHEEVCEAKAGQDTQTGRTGRTGHGRPCGLPQG